MSVRRPERRAGVLPVVKPMMKEMMVVLVKKRKDPATASETVVHQERTPGGEEAQMKEAAGETPAKRTMGMIVVTAWNAVMIAMWSVVIEIVEMTVNPELHKESLMTEVLGVVEVMTRGRKRIVPERGSVKLTEKRAGVPTKKTLVAPRMRQMMMAGPLSAVEQQSLQSIGCVN